MEEWLAVMIIVGQFAVNIVCNPAIVCFSTYLGLNQDAADPPHSGTHINSFSEKLKAEEAMKFQKQLAAAGEQARTLW